MRDFLTGVASLWQVIAFCALVTAAALWADRRSDRKWRAELDREQTQRCRDVERLRQEYRAGAPRRRGQDLPTVRRTTRPLPANVVDITKGGRP